MPMTVENLSTIAPTGDRNLIRNIATDYRLGIPEFLASKLFATSSDDTEISLTRSRSVPWATGRRRRGKDQYCPQSEVPTFVDLNLDREVAVYFDYSNLAAEW